ncbi:PREDICTED: protein FAM208B [Pseudopodoces humilis]|nr:PREDICTED: protein FAM208B [Pseudopodoces humilis]
MGERRRGESGEPGTGFPAESEELLERAVELLRSCCRDSGSQQGFRYSQAILVENELFRSELRAFARAKAAAGYSPEELRESFAFLLFEREDEARAVCQRGLRVNSSSLRSLGDPAKGVYISEYPDWQRGKSGFIVICRLIKGKVRPVSESSGSCSRPSPGYDCHASARSGQCYVFEVSGGGGAAERPRQVCPYIRLAWSRETRPEHGAGIAEQKPQAPCRWRGQLCLRGRRLGTIALRSAHGAVPAQL